METPNVTAPAPAVARGASAPKRAPAPRQEAPVMGESSGSSADYKVSISTDAGSVVENHGSASHSAQAQRTAQEKTAQAKERAKGNDQQAGDDLAAQAIQANYAVSNPNLKMDYLVENKELVIKVVNRQDSQVVKEIPAEQERHIRDTVQKYIDSGGNIMSGSKK
ncbi:MAG: flagellar protein FlaG [Nitrospinae bacterium]|nr:flagellar protein FlaG [Nitrospinota bacterium]